MNYETREPSSKIIVNKLAEEPGVLAVSMAEMRLALRVDGEDEDLTIRRKLQAATDYFEIRCAWRLTPASYRADVYGYARQPIVIPRGPLRNLAAIEAWDKDAEVYAMITGDHWEAIDNGPEFSVILASDIGHEFPCERADGAPVLRLYFEAGFDGAEGTVTSTTGQPESGMIECVKTLTSVMFQKREEPADSEKDMIVRRYRKFW